jgi:hypothetical protein
MAYLFEFPNGTIAGGDVLAASLVAEIPAIPGIFLFVVYTIILLSGALGQSFKRGYVDFALWSMFGLLTVDLLALIMSMGEGIISPIVLGVCFGLTILNALWFFLSSDRFNQN